MTNTTTTSPSSDSGQITLKELDQQLFACADILRGSIDSGKYKDYILPLVFYAATDRWYTHALEKEYYELDLGDSFDEEDIDGELEEVIRKNAADSFMGIRVPREHSWENLENTNKGVAKRIDEAFEAFEDANPSYSDIHENEFANVGSFTESDGDAMLQNLLQEIGDAIQREDREIPADVMGEAYMDLVKRFSKADAGEYFTTPTVVRLMVQILDPFEDGSTFHDPTSGSGGMLVEAANQITAQYLAENGPDVSEEELYNHLASFRFTGQERNPTVSGIGKMNLAINNLDGEIRRGDSISNPRFTKNGELEQFDYILANFPFSAKGWKDGAEARQKEFGDLDWTDSLPHGSYGDFVFIQHMESHLAEQGQLATVIPHGVLFRNTDQEYREWLINNDLIEAIIGLPENLFENTGIPSAILVLNRDKSAEREGEVMFFNAAVEDRFYKDTGNDRNDLIDPQEDYDGDDPFLYSEMEGATGIAEIKQMFDAWVSEERVCRVVSTERIQENDCNLNISLYVDTTEPQPDIDVTEQLRELRELEAQYESLNKRFTTYMEQLNYEEEIDD